MIKKGHKKYMHATEFSVGQAKLHASTPTHADGVPPNSTSSSVCRPPPASQQNEPVVHRHHQQITGQVEVPEGGTGTVAESHELGQNVTALFPPWLIDVEPPHANANQFMLPGMLMPLDYDTNIGMLPAPFPPPPPPPIAYPAPHGQAVAVAEEEQVQQQLFSGLYDPLAAVAALAAGNGQFGGFLPSSSAVDFYAYPHHHQHPSLSGALTYPSLTPSQLQYPIGYNNGSVDHQMPPYANGSGCELYNFNHTQQQAAHPWYF